MAKLPRQYPRFLFSNPQNVKGNAAFVYHTAEPHIIIGIYSNSIDKSAFTWTKQIEPKPQFIYQLALLTSIKANDEKEVKKFHDVLDNMVEWLYFQIKNDHITIK